MTHGQRMLLETLAGHFAWLRTAHPRKAKSPLARRAQRAVKTCLRTGALLGATPRARKAA